MKNIAVTGISGYIGTKLLAYLDRTDSVQKIIGIDAREPRSKPTKLKFYQQDIREPLGALLAENEVDTAVHLAFVLQPNRQVALTRQIDIEGTRNMLEACRRAHVKHLLYLSSHTVYGAHKDNPAVITEDSPLRPVPGFQYSRDKIEVEKMLHDYIGSIDITVTVLRCCPVLGPNAIGSTTTIMFRPPVMVGVAGCDPPMQFLHEDDLVNLIGLFIHQGKGGIYNVAGDGVLRYSEVARLMKKRLLKLPGILLEPAISFSWAMHLQSASPAGGLEFIKYPPVVSTDRLKKETEFVFRYSTKEALASFAAFLNDSVVH
jgi:UDP-glucose 4-epimerase